MASQRNAPKINFKVKHLNKYHDMAIDWNDDRYEYKYQQLFEQLESVTGVPSRYASSVCVPRPDEVNSPGVIACYFTNLEAYAPDCRPRCSNDFRDHYRDDDTYCQSIRDGDRFHLQYFVYYDERVAKRINMGYRLVRERLVTEGACSRDFCQSKCTESYLIRLKYLVNNYDLNAKITQLVQPLLETFSDLGYSQVDQIFREFNVKQYCNLICVECRGEEIEENGNERQDDLYLRNRG